MMFEYPHMCRDEHQQIGHSDSEHERCPLCRANDEIEYLKERLAATEWISVEEKLPEEIENGYRWVRVFDAEWNTQYDAYWNVDKWERVEDRAEGIITHWMPYPDAPPLKPIAAPPEPRGKA